MTMKLTPAAFNYYVLEISLKNEMEEVADKLTSLRKFDDQACYLVLDIIELINEQQLNELIIQVANVARQYDLKIIYLKASPLLSSDKVAGIPVVELPREANKIQQVVNNVSKFVTEPVRSGAVVKNDGDIIVLGLVSHNAEVISTGHIHVYGDCRGKLRAGNNGDKTAHIFVERFNAELISIAGIFKVIEDKLPNNLHNKAVHIFLDEKERLNIVPR